MKNVKPIMTIIAIVMTAVTTWAQIPAPVSLQLKIKCEALTDQKEKYLVFLTLTKQMNNPDEILNSFLTPGPYGPFELIAVPLAGGNRSDNAIMEKFDAATIEGSQLSAAYKFVSRVQIKETHVDIHVSEQSQTQPLQVLGIKYKKI